MKTKKKIFINNIKKLNNEEIVNDLRNKVEFAKVAKKQGVSCGRLNAYMAQFNLWHEIWGLDMVESVTVENGVTITKYKPGYAVGASYQRHFGEYF